MSSLQRLRDFETLKVLLDARRMIILRILMSRPATLSQLGEVLGEHPALIRHHLKKMEQYGLIEMVETRMVRGFVEKYYKACSSAFWLNEIILPAAGDRKMIVFMGSDDLALELLTEILPQECRGEMGLLLLPVGSLDGLILLRQGISEIAGCHLLDWDSGEYNRPFVRHLFPDRNVSLVALASREQGLIFAPGNPLDIRSLDDLGKPGIHFINRHRGSGTRLWLDNQLQNLQIPVVEIEGYKTEVGTHVEVARNIANGFASVGIGLRAAAERFNLEFVPLFQERYDLVVPAETRDSFGMSLLLELINSGKFRHSMEGLGGYDVRQTGVQISL